jgi:hypothetical protein
VKIDTSSIDLSSQHLFTKKAQIHTQERISFNHLFDNRIRQYQTRSIRPDHRIGHAGAWYERTVYIEQPAVQLKHQFVRELEKLKQMFDSIIQQLNQVRNAFSMRLSSVDRIFINTRHQASGNRMAYQYSREQTVVYHEAENTDFFANGVVNTMDGRTIDFSFEMNMKRDFFKTDQIASIHQGYTLIDPLVVNLDASMPQLAQARFSFDLDADGEDEKLPSLMPGSGLLALDKNHDGVINDGSELFGPTTGKGFEELSAYDLDQNRWIDENDAVFDQLTLWENDDQGQMHLTRIKDAGIGAIYLETIETPFELKDETNQRNARIKSSGLALNEDGSVGSIQEIEWQV